MALQLTTNRSRRGLTLAGTFFAMFALFVQPLVALNIPAAFAASLVVDPASHSVDGGDTKVSTLNASNYQNMVLSFNHIAANLEVGDDLNYGWREHGGTNHQLGVIQGEKNTNPGSVPGPNENGSKAVDLPAAAAVSNLEIYFTNSGGGRRYDTVEINSIAISQNTPPDTTGPSVDKIRINGETVSGAYKHDENCDPIDELYLVSGDLNLNAVITDDNEVGSAYYKVKKLNDGGCTVTSEYSSNKIQLKQSSKNTSNWNQQATFDTKAEGLNGKYAAKLVTEDATGNKTTKYVHLKIDNTKPVFSDVVFSPALFNSTKTELSITGTLTDEASPISKMNYAVWEKNNDGTKGDVVRNWTDLPAADGAYDELSEELNVKINLSGVGDGEYIIGLRGLDKAQNRASGGDFSFEIDNTAPDASLEVSPSSPTTNDTVVVTGSADELHIKSHWFEIKTPLGNTYYNTEKMNTTENSHSFELNTTDGAGEYTIRYVASDRAGNRSDDPNYSNSTVKVVTVTAPAPISENGGSKQPTDKPKNDNDAPTTPQGRSGGTPAATVANGNPFVASTFTTPFGAAFAANNGVNTDGNDDATSDEQGDEEVLGATAQSDENGDVLAATDDTTECGKFLGICWYWWIPIVIAIVGAVWFYLATRNRDGKDDMPFGDQPPRRQP